MDLYTVILRLSILYWPPRPSPASPVCPSPPGLPLLCVLDPVHCMCIKSPSSISRSLGTKSYSTAGYTYNSKYNNISYQYIGRVTRTAQWVFPQFQSIETYLRMMSHTIIEFQVIRSWKLRIKGEDKNTCYRKPYFLFSCVILKVSITIYAVLSLPVQYCLSCL